VAGTLGVTGDLSVNTNRFSVTAASGNTTVAGTLGVTGAGTFSSTLGVTGDVAVNTNKFNVIAANGNTTIAGTLGVTGATTLSSTLGVTGNATFAGTITGPSAAATSFSIDNGNASAINIGGLTATTLNLGRSGQTQALLGNATVAGTLGVTGATTLSSSLGVTGNTTLGGTLTGPAAATFTIDSGGANAINIGGVNGTTLNLGRSGQAQALLGNGTVAGSLGVTGATTLSSTLAVNNLTTATGGIKMGGAGTTILAHYSVTASLSFGTITPGLCSTLPITVTNAAVGDTVLATPAGVAGGAETLPTPWQAWVSASNTVSVRLCNYSVGNVTAAIENWRADVWHH
jgi:hypothetical protein